MKCIFYGIIVLILGSFCQAKLKQGECEVCIKFLTKFNDKLDDHKDIEKQLLSFCENSKGKDHRFCYYIGATHDAATRTYNDITRQIKSHIPAEKICEKLKEKDAQICELQYEQKIDIKNQDLKKMRVKQLKKVLESWDEQCNGCIEKNDFIERIEELKHKHMEL